MNSKKNYELHYLSDKFYDEYNEAEYPEILHKDKRPYMILLIKVESNTFGLPLRTNIAHNNCYKFEYTSRSTDTITGIDFSKAVVIIDSEYIGSEAEMDNKEYVELNNRINFIISRFRTYIKGYYLYASGKADKYQAKKYRFTTLKYFHKELGI